MVRLIVKSYLRPECLEKAAPLYREMLEKTRKEDGCIQYDLFTDVKDETCYVFVECWESQARLDAHIASEHFQRIIPQINEFKDDREGGATFIKEFA